MKDISTQFTHLYKVISSQTFLNRESLGGEIPFFISAYNAKQELEIKESIKLLINKLENSGIKILELNLYELTCEI